MIRYYQSWCGHSIRMKPDWDRLASELLEGDNHHPSSSGGVFIADVNCGTHKVLCDMAGVTGYPTLRYYIDGQERPYDGGRGLEDLLGFVKEELVVRCDVNGGALVLAETCSEKAAQFVQKWREREVTVLKKEVERLRTMERGDMTLDLKGWLRERLRILGQLIDDESAEKKRHEQKQRSEEKEEL